MSPLLGPSITISNALCDLSGALENRGHPAAGKRVIRFRSAFDRWSCRWLLGQPRVIYGAVRDICLDCLTVVDEHPNGRGRGAK